MTVKPGTVFKENPLQKVKDTRQAYKLREKMVPNKYRNLYKSMMEGRRKREKEIWLLKKKRRLIDAAEKTKKKEEKKKKHIEM